MLQRRLIRHVLAPALDVLRGTYRMRLFEQLLESQWWPHERIQELQHHRLERLIHHAYANVPYYRRVMDERGIQPSDIRTVRDLKLLPVLTKDNVRDHSDELRAEGFPSRELLLGQTGGSTGTPLVFHSSRQARWSHGLARSMRALTWAGVYPGDSAVHVMKRKGRGPVKTPPFGRIVTSLTRETVIDSTYLSDATLPDAVQHIARWRPMSLRGYASAICIIAEYIRETGMPAPQVGAVVVGGEQLFDEQRELIREVFGTEPFSKYSSFENYDIAMECEAHEGMHVAAEDLIVELVNDDGHPVGQGVEGHLVVTNLHEYGMPLIRYCTDDESSFLAGQCSCGRSLPRLSAVTGKTGDTIYTPSGRRMSPLALRSSELAPMDIRQFQFVQKKLDLVTVRIVPSVTLDSVDSAALRRRVTTHYTHVLGGDVHVEVHIVDRIEPTAAGKHLFLISHVKRPGARTLAASQSTA